MGVAPPHLMEPVVRMIGGTHVPRGILDFFLSRVLSVQRVSILKGM